MLRDVFIHQVPVAGPKMLSKFQRPNGVTLEGPLADLGLICFLTNPSGQSLRDNPL